MAPTRGEVFARATQSRRQSWKAGGAACCSSGPPWLPNQALGFRFKQPCERPVRCAGWLGGGFSHRHQRKHSLVIGTSYPQGLRLHHPDEFYARQLLASTAKGISPRVSVALLRPFSLTSPTPARRAQRGSAPQLTPCRLRWPPEVLGAWPWIAAMPISPPQRSRRLTSPIAAAGPPRWRHVTATASRCLARRG